jgi:NDP-sugar pyrophosphorylase family protein
MDVILTAGGIPSQSDPLYLYTQGKPKAMLPINGKPMIQWVLDSLASARGIDQVLLVGLDEEFAVSYPRKLTRLANQGDMVSNIISAAMHLLNDHSSAAQTIVMASDVPAIRPAMLEWMVDQIKDTDNDITYTVVTQSVMEERFPESKRTYVKLKDGAVCGGDVNAINIQTVNFNNPVWRGLVDNRKNVFKQAALIGFDTLLLLLMRAFTLKKAEERVCQRLRIKGRLIVSPYAETAMDVDKPGQLEMLQSEFFVNERLQF